MLRYASLIVPFALVACGAGVAPTALPFEISEVATFERPWAMAFLPDGRALITEKPGRLKLWREGGQLLEVSGVPSVVYEGQGGLGDVAVHPDFARNHYVYLSWVAQFGIGRGAVVGRAKLVDEESEIRLEGLEIVWRQDPVSGTGHFGHRIAFGPDGKLYISSGERQKFDPAQELLTNLGKIVRVNDDGSPANDNPYAKLSEQARASIGSSVHTPFFEDALRVANAPGQIWTLGHRNPLGLAFDASGRLWETEMGPRGGDELNLIEREKDYGWPEESNGSHYDGRDIPDPAPGSAFVAPKVWWNPSISPSSLMIYSGDRFPQWKGDAFIGALSGRALIRVHLDGIAASKGDQWPMDNRIREVEQGPDGAIWLLEDGDEARLLKLTPRVNR